MYSSKLQAESYSVCHWPDQWHTISLLWRADILHTLCTDIPSMAKLRSLWPIFFKWQTFLFLFIIFLLNLYIYFNDHIVHLLFSYSSASVCFLILKYLFVCASFSFTFSKMAKELRSTWAFFLKKVYCMPKIFHCLYCISWHKIDES